MLASRRRSLRLLGGAIGTALAAPAIIARATPVYGPVNLRTDYGAQGIGAAFDDSAAFSNAMNDLASNGYGGGEIILPPGNYNVTASVGVTHLGGVAIRASSPFSTTVRTFAGGSGFDPGIDCQTWTFDPGCYNPSVYGFAIWGSQTLGCSQNTFVVSTNVRMKAENMAIGYGQYAIAYYGVDSVFDFIDVAGNHGNMYLAGGVHMSNIRSDVHFVPPGSSGPLYSLCVGSAPAGICEIFIDKSDFSGAQNHSIDVNDGGRSNTNLQISKSVISKGCVVTSGKSVQLIDVSMNGQATNNAPTTCQFNIIHPTLGSNIAPISPGVSVF